MSQKTEAFEVIVRGRVQRVGYRRYLLDLAQELGVTGFAENMEDGGVRIFCQAPLQVIEEFFEKARNPPPPAIIKQFDIREARPRPKLKYFRIRYGPVQEELQEGFGAMQSLFMSYWAEFKDYRSEFRNYWAEFRDYRSEFRDYWAEFRDYRSEFRDYWAEFKDYRSEFRNYREESRKFRDESLEVSHEVLKEMIELRKDLKTMLDERLAKMERDIAEIKAKLGLP